MGVAASVTAPQGARAGASQPLVVGDPTKSQAAADAAAASGLGPKVATVLNEDIGAILGGSAVLRAATGSPEISSATQRANSQDIRDNQARSVLLGGPGRRTVQAQKWVIELIPRDVRVSLDSDRIAAASTNRKSSNSGLLLADHVQKNRIGRSAKMVDLLKTVNRRGNAFHPRLQLEGQKLRIVARLV
jgi:hypothetical protein